jgi:hypothetical protein
MSKIQNFSKIYFALYTSELKLVFVLKPHSNKKNEKNMVFISIIKTL